MSVGCPSHYECLEARMAAAGCVQKAIQAMRLPVPFHSKLQVGIANATKGRFWTEYIKSANHWLDKSVRMANHIQLMGG